MTVGELIRVLKDYDEDLPVLFHAPPEHWGRFGVSYSIEAVSPRFKTGSHYETYEEINYHNKLSSVVLQSSIDWENYQGPRETKDKPKK